MHCDSSAAPRWHVQVVGVNHRTAPLDVREQLALQESDTSSLITHLRQALPAEEVVFVSTCNRVELYLAGPEIIPREHALTVLSTYAHADAAAVDAHAYSHDGEECVRHLFRVTASLDSMVVGEAEVLGQVKQAYHAATEAGGVGKALNGLFQRAFSVAKAVRTETALGRGHVSVASVAVDFALRIFKALADKTILVIGAGEAAEGVVRALVQRGATAVLVANRSYDRAVELSRRYAGSAIRFDQLTTHLAQADIIIGSSAAPHAVITLEHVRDARRRRHNRPMLFLDISTPRDIDPAVGHLDNVYLYNLDDLHEVAKQHVNLRHQELVMAGAIADAAATAFIAEFHAPDLGPTIAAVRESWTAIAEAELQRTLNRINGAADHDREEIRHLSERLVNKLLHQPVQEVKTAAGEPDGHHIVRAFQRLLHLRPRKP